METTTALGIGMSISALSHLGRKFLSSQAKGYFQIKAPFLFNLVRHGTKNRGNLKMEDIEAKNYFRKIDVFEKITPFLLYYPVHFYSILA